MLKAIETVYKGYKFRSRLEARWAVFFDVMGIEYQYEPEGFDLGKDGFYLPDFYLPGYDLYIEVKPSRTLFDNERNKAISLVKGGKKLLILLDCVEEKDALIVDLDVVTDEYCLTPVTLLACDICGCLGIYNQDYSFVFELKEHCGGPANNTWKKLSDARLDKSEDGRIIYNFPNRHLQKAYTMAKQARFEFGQTPVVR